MSLKNKLIYFVFFLVLFSCQNTTENNTKFSVIQGEAQGTTYTIQLVGEGIKIKKQAIDSILKDFDNSLSTYKNYSLISQFNNSEKSFSALDFGGYFNKCLVKSQFIYDVTNGAFDPTVFPLIEAWGFFSDMKTPLNQSKADSILKFIGFDKNRLISYYSKNDSIFITKKDSRLKLDFNAIAQGYSVDVIADFIKKNGYKNYYIEIGGEIRVAGKNKEGNDWRIGIDTPKSEGERSIQEIINVSNKSIATSGNYRKYYEIDGKKYAHTIVPQTGMQVKHNLLSATVITEECALADGFATAFMVLGLNGTKKFLIENPRLKIQVLLIYSEKGKFKTYSTISK